MREAEKFRKAGFYDSQLGDSMVLALANTLNLPIIVFTSNICYPIVYVTPRDKILSANLHCLYAVWSGPL